MTVKTGRFLALVLLVVCAFAPGCSRQVLESSGPMSTAAQNAKRARVGIRPTKETWRPLRSQNGYERWNDARGVLCKVVKLTPTDALQWEEDYYQSGRMFTEPDGTFAEMLTVHFDYSTQAVALFYRGTNQAIHRMVMPFERYHNNHADMKDAMCVADEVLRTWGMSRL